MRAAEAASLYFFRESAAALQFDGLRHEIKQESDESFANLEARVEPEARERCPGAELSALSHEQDRAVLKMVESEI